jgi:flagellar basal-body rod modification protein FlgD
MATNIANVNAAGINLTSTAGKTVTEKDKSSLDKDAFLKLLAAQAKSQDPMNPTDSSAQIAQLAQFSSLEQMLNVATEMGKLRTTTNQQAAVQLVGHTVTYQDAASGTAVTGTVDKVTMAADGPKLSIAGKDNVDPATITEVR